MSPEVTLFKNVKPIADLLVFVPVVADGAPAQGTAEDRANRFRVISKATLNAELAPTYVDDMLTSLRLRFDG